MNFFHDLATTADDLHNRGGKSFTGINQSSGFNARRSVIPLTNRAIQIFTIAKAACLGYGVLDMVVLNGIRCVRSHGLVEDPKEASPQTRVAIIAPRMSIVREPREHQSGCFQIRNSNEVFVPMLWQRLNRLRHMLITRSDDGYFGRNSKT